MQLDPVCVHCSSVDVVHNGYYSCEASFLVSLGLDIKLGHYLCNDCKKTFSISFPMVEQFKTELSTFLAETCFSLFMKGMSFGGIAQHISEHFGISLSDETARKYYTKIARSFRSRKVLESSGFFSVDCQHVRVSGNKLVRLSVRDLQTNLSVVDVDIEAETNEEIVDRLRLFLLPYKVKGMVVDGKGGLLRALKKEFRVPIQRCIMHVQKLIVQDYVKKYGNALTLLELRNMYMLLNILMDHDAEVEHLNKLLKEKIIARDDRRLVHKFHEFRLDLRRFRRKQEQYLIPRTEEEMREKLAKAKMFLTEKHEKRRIKKIEKEWKELTEFLRVEGLQPTNNAIEHYYSKTLTKTDKKRFRTRTALQDRIAACRAVFNKWFKPTVTLQGILQKYARLFLWFSA